MKDKETEVERDGDWRYKDYYKEREMDIFH